MNKLKELIFNLWKLLIYKDGSPSKTGLFVSLATLIALTLWFVQGMFVGLTIWGFTIPEFNYVASASMLTTIYALYVANHKIKTKTSSDGIEIDKTNG